MVNEEKISDEKLQYDINREAAKMPAFTSGKIDKYVTGGKCDLIIKKEWEIQAKFTNSRLGKALEKQTKTIKSQSEKQVKAI